MPVGIIRTATYFLIFSAHQINKKTEVCALLPLLERLHVCVPDGNANLLTLERLCLICVNIASLNDCDYLALVGLSKQLIAICSSEGVPRMFALPFAIEFVLERILGALDLANDLLAHKLPDASESQCYVLHHRSELYGML